MAYYHFFYQIRCRRRYSTDIRCHQNYCFLPDRSIDFIIPTDNTTCHLLSCLALHCTASHCILLTIVLSVEGIDDSCVLLCRHASLELHGGSELSALLGEVHSEQSPLLHYLSVGGGLLVGSLHAVIEVFDPKGILARLREGRGG